MGRPPKIRYRVEIPECIVKDPIQGAVDSFTMIMERGGIEACERAVETIMDVMYDNDWSSK